MLKGEKPYDCSFCFIIYHSYNRHDQGRMVDDPGIVAHYDTGNYYSVVDAAYMKLIHT